MPQCLASSTGTRVGLVMLVLSCRASSTTECTDDSRQFPACQAPAQGPGQADAAAAPAAKAAVADAPATELAPASLTAPAVDVSPPVPQPVVSDAPPSAAPLPPGPDTTPPVAGTGLLFTSVTPTSVTLAWGPASDLVTPAAKLQYRVVRVQALSDLTSADKVVVIFDWSSNRTSTTDPTVTAGSTYYYAVSVRDAAGNITDYAPQSVTPADRTPPTPGAALSVPVVAATSMSLSWGSATDDTTPQAQLLYKLVCIPAAAGKVDDVLAIDAINTVAAGLVMDWTTAVTAAQASGLTGGVTYACNVAVKDSTGNEAAYGSKYQTTLASTITVTGLTLPAAVGQAVAATIHWISSGIPEGAHVAIASSPDAGTTWSTVTPATTNSGAYSWNPTAAVGGSTLFHVSLVGQPSVYGQTIVPASIK